MCRGHEALRGSHKLAVVVWLAVVLRRAGRVVQRLADVHVLRGVGALAHGLLGGVGHLAGNDAGHKSSLSVRTAYSGCYGELYPSQAWVRACSGDLSLVNIFSFGKSFCFAIDKVWRLPYNETRILCLF